MKNPAGAIATLLSLILLPLAFLWDGFALKTLWGWYAVPLGAPALTLVGAIGLGILVSSFYMASFMVTRLRMAKESEPTDETDKAVRNFSFFLATAFAPPALSLFFGYIVHLFQ